MEELRTDKIDNAICHAQRTSSLNTPTNILDFSLKLLPSLSTLKLGEERLRQRSKARHDIPPNKLPRLTNITLLRNLHLQFAAPKAKIQDLLDTRLLTVGQGRVVLGDLVPARNSQINTSFSDKGRDIGGGQEDECDW